VLLEQFAFIGIFLIVAFIFGVAPSALAFLFRPKKPGPRETEDHEHDIQTYNETWVQFDLQYYIFALAFTIFDVAVIFLLPWALAYHTLQLEDVIQAIIFIMVLLGGLIYVWRKGALRWV
jgi:NADH-quinone oxidoreductase subunit A